MLWDGDPSCSYPRMVTGLGIWLNILTWRLRRTL